MVGRIDDDDGWMDGRYPNNAMQKNCSLFYFTLLSILNFAGEPEVVMLE
jgi:hypothetical protein